jgi:hypothetical protein
LIRFHQLVFTRPRPKGDVAFPFERGVEAQSWGLSFD